MRRTLLALLCLLLAFYVGWPAWSALQLRNALKAEDVETVTRKIDFPGVRATLRPSIEDKAGQVFDAYAKQLGAGGALITGQLKPQILPKLIESALDTLVTPQNVIRIANDQGTFGERIERVLREQMGRLPGVPGGTRSEGGTAARGVELPANLGQIAGQFGIGGGRPQVGTTGTGGATPSEPVKVEKPRSNREFGLSNVKGFSFTGPLGFEIALAKDAKAVGPDIVARMGFGGLDWKLVGLVPKLR